MSDSLQTLWYTRCAVPTPLGIAGRLGWLQEEFRPEGITVKPMLDRENAVACESGEAFDHSFRLGGSIAALAARAHGAETKLVGLSWVDEFQGIVTLPDRGLKSVKDLRGRKLGLTKQEGATVDLRRASALRAFISLLDVEGIAHDAVEFVDLHEPRNCTSDLDSPIPRRRVIDSRRRAGSAPLIALARGDVDAIYLSGPRGLQLVHQLNLQVLTDLGSHPEPLVRANNCTPRTLTVNRRLLLERPDIVARLVRTVVEASAWAAAHPDKAITLIGKETCTADIWVRHSYGDDVASRLDLNLAETSIQALAHLKSFLVARHFIGADFDLRSWIDATPLEEVSAGGERSVA